MFDLEVPSFCCGRRMGTKSGLTEKAVFDIHYIHIQQQMQKVTVLIYKDIKTDFQ